MVIFTLLSLLFIILSLLFADFKKWKKFYSTILFLNLGELGYKFFFRDNPLWELCSSSLSPTRIEIIWIVIIFPCTVLIYLSKYPYDKRLYEQILFIVLWIVGYSIMELFLYINKGICYHNNWTFWWSVGFNVFMFPNLTIHHIKPIYSMLLTTVFFIFIVIKFKIPI